MGRLKECKQCVDKLGQIYSNVRVFHKCPLELIKPEPLEKYNISLEEYMYKFEQISQTSYGEPLDLKLYVTQLIENTPYIWPISIGKNGS